MKILRNTFLIFCIIFTIGTLVSSSVQLTMGISEDTNIHIIDRAVLTLMGSFVLVLVTQYDFKNRFNRIFLPYIIFIMLAMVYVWISGFWSELHPNAYRDVFLNDTIVYLIVVAVVEIVDRVKKKSKK